MSGTGISAVPDRALAPHDCELAGCRERAARGRRYCTVNHLLIASFREREWA